MIVAQNKKKENIAEYLLYMWQVEDLIRANHFDIDAIRQTVISRYEQPEEIKQDIARWYEKLIHMMRTEGVMEKGHLQIHKDVITDLTDCHTHLLQSPEEMLYNATYDRTLPYIVQLRAKSGGNDLPELETCFTAVYGYFMLKMQGKEVSATTEEAIRQVAAFLALLAARHKEKSFGESIKIEETL
ncbi:MAG: DUF4924 family protein [Tannerellaceae bacterium]|jgi:hypothetical protein|nr:DUF4924 family protein [Tannerellaceae bacterium]